MHNRLPDGLVSREITLREAIVIVPLVLCILAIAVYPGLITTRGEESVDRSLASLCEGTYSNGETSARTGCPEGVPESEAVAQR